jgi:DNA-binding NarL/FixJ family response regulator
VVVKKFRYGKDSSIFIPDCWSGKRKLVPVLITTETEHYISLPERQFFLSEGCKKITLISSDKFFIFGIKGLLEKVTDLSLKIHYDVNQFNKLVTETDRMMILNISTRAELYKFYRMILNTATPRKYNSIIIYASDSVESELKHLTKIFHGINVLSLKSDINTIETSILHSSFTNHSSSNKQKKLTGRQSEILMMLAKGLSVKVIARQLGIKPGTVYTLKRRALDKAGACNKSFEAIFYGQNVTQSQHCSRVRNCVIG